MEAVPQTRQQRKAATRRSLILSAQTLFAKNGYRETTLEEVAGHAGLHVQTLYRHFANKIELSEAGDEEKLERFRLAIRSDERSDCTFKFWRNWLEDVISRATADEGGRYYGESLIERWGPELMYSPVGVHYEDLLAESLDKDYPQNDGEPGLSLTRLAAIALRGANLCILRRYTRDSGFDLTSEVVAAVDSVDAIYRPLLEASVRRKP